jgi:hypothetical protein
MKHVHTMDIRPDVITRTGVIQPYAIREVPPGMVARHSVRAFEQTARPRGPQVKSEMEPEEFVALAKRVAVAQAAGKRFARGVSPKLLAAAKMIREGRPFKIRAAGRTAIVSGSPKIKGERKASPKPQARRLVATDVNGAAVGPSIVHPALMKQGLPYRTAPMRPHVKRLTTEAYYQGSGTATALAPRRYVRALGG